MSDIQKMLAVQIENAAIRVGDVCHCERRLSWGSLSSKPEHAWTKTVARVTAKRAYFADGDWFALNDLMREVKPKYLEYTTRVVEVRRG